MTTTFDYHVAFQRNLGFISEAEQERLRHSRVAVAGLGGTGGSQVHALARMGIGAFNLADPDIFEMININRQSGANIHTLGRAKTSVCKEVVKGINPEADIRLYSEGIHAGNIDSFLEGVDVVVDSLDFYCFQERLILYRAARNKGLWVLTAPPMGFGFTLLAFDPEGMRFEDYFGFTPDMPQSEMEVALIAGIAPRPFLLQYLDIHAIDPAARRLPSVGAAPFMIAGVIATEVVNHLVGKGRLIRVPTVIQYDAMLRRYRRHVYPFGMRGPLQFLKKAVIRRRLAKT